MNRRAILPIASLILAASLASAQQTDITTGLPAVFVNLNKLEIYNVDEYKANIARIDATFYSRLNPAIDEDERNQAHMELMAGIKPKLLDSQISAMLFKQFCDRESVFVTDDDITAYIVRLKGQLGVPTASDATFEEALTVSQGIVLGLKTYARGRLLLTRYLNQKRGAELKVLKTPSPEAIQAAYQEMKPSFVVPQIAKISKIYIAYKGMGEAARKAAVEKMKALAAEVKDNRGRFDELLFASFDPESGYSARSSFKIGNVRDEASEQEIKYLDAVFSMKPGELSGLLDNSEELQIIRVNEITPSMQLQLYDDIPGSSSNISVLDIVVGQLANDALEEFALKVQAEILAKLRSEATVTFNKNNLRGIIGDSEIDSLVERYEKKKK